eukprot:47322_1
MLTTHPHLVAMISNLLQIRDSQSPTYSMTEPTPKVEPEYDEYQKEVGKENHKQIEIQYQELIHLSTLTNQLRHRKVKLRSSDPQVNRWIYLFNSKQTPYKFDIGSILFHSRLLHSHQHNDLTNYNRIRIHPDPNEPIVPKIQFGIMDKISNPKLTPNEIVEYSIYETEDLKQIYKFINAFSGGKAFYSHERIKGKHVKFAEVETTTQRFRTLNERNSFMDLLLGLSNCQFIIDDSTGEKCNIYILWTPQIDSVQMIDEEGDLHQSEPLFARCSVCLEAKHIYAAPLCPKHRYFCDCCTTMYCKPHYEQEQKTDCCSRCLMQMCRQCIGSFGDIPMCVTCQPHWQPHQWLDLTHQLRRVQAEHGQLLAFNTNKFYSKMKRVQPTVRLNEFALIYLDYLKLSDLNGNALSDTRIVPFYLNNNTKMILKLKTVNYDSDSDSNNYEQKEQKSE